MKAKPRVEKNRVLVTGGAGFVGSHLCDYLVARGDHVGAACFSVPVLCATAPLHPHLFVLLHQAAGRSALLLSCAVAGGQTLRLWQRRAAAAHGGLRRCTC